MGSHNLDSKMDLSVEPWKICQNIVVTLNPLKKSTEEEKELEGHMKKNGILSKHTDKSTSPEGNTVDTGRLSILFQLWNLVEMPEYASKLHGKFKKITRISDIISMKRIGTVTQWKASLYFLQCQVMRLKYFTEMFNRKEEEKKKEGEEGKKGEKEKEEEKEHNVEIGNDDNESEIDPDPTDSESTTSTGDHVTNIIIDNDRIEEKERNKTESETSGSIHETSTVK